MDMTVTSMIDMSNFLNIRNKIIKLIKKLNWKAGFYRKDIGWKAIRNENN